MKKHADAFLDGLRTGKIVPADLITKSSKERREFFESIVGEENAREVNALFETKLLLKNQTNGLINWAKTVAGLRPKARRDLISQIERMNKILTPANQQAYLEDLASQKLKTNVSFAEATEINTLSNEVEAKEAVMNASVRRDILGKPTAEEMDYGHAVVNLTNYVSELKKQSNKTTLADIKQNPSLLITKPIDIIALNSKAIQASMDNSAIFRQGWKALWTHPRIWAKNASKSFYHLVKVWGQEAVMNQLHADIMSRPTYDLMQKAKLDVGVSEEAYPTTLPEKIPLLGRVYKSSENAYTAFVQKTRADIFDKYIDIAGKSGVDLNPNELQSIGKMVNSLTGRGHLGKLEPIGSTLNSVFFSPKNTKGLIDAFTQPVSGAGGSNFVRKQSAINLIRMIAGTAAIMAIAKLWCDDCVDFDMRSANFGKIKIRNTRFDITGGMGSLATLAARLATFSSKSSVTDEINPLNAKDKEGKPKFAATTTEDVVIDFFENKASPIGRIVLDILKGETFDHQKPTVAGEALSLITPLPGKTGVELWQDPNAANFVIGMLADALGVSVNTYGGSKDIKKQMLDADKRGDMKEVERLKKVLKQTLEIERNKVQYNKAQQPQSENKTQSDLDDELNSGKITRKQYEAGVDKLKLSDVQIEAKNLDASKDEDFDKIEGFLEGIQNDQTVSNDDKAAIGTILMDKQANKLKDDSPKARADAARLQALIDKYLPGATPTPSKSINSIKGIKGISSSIPGIR